MASQVAAAIEAAALWHKVKATEPPYDERHLAAAEKLRSFAGHVRALPDTDHWLIELEATHLDVDREYLVGTGVVAALRRLGFGWQPAGVDAFLRELVALEAEDLALNA
jgi:hypothetical protein